MRRPEWKQANPRDQLVAVLMAAEGWADNIVANKSSIAKQTQRIHDLFEQAHELINMLDGSWPEDK